jgi:immunoglobulin-binding protein 1
MELEILAFAPASLEEMPDVDIRESNREQDDTTWRLDLDSNPRRLKPRQLISGGGKVLRPFTILPSTNASSDRERLAGEVFRESWRLPTMTIDEYLAEEQRQGNIITGGG